MHQTTVRFSVDLWEDLEAEARRLGVSVAQFVREAALARLMYSAGRRGDESIGRSLGDATAASRGRRSETTSTVPPADDALSAAPPMRTAQEARERADDNRESATALAAQGVRARARARELREYRRRTRETSGEPPPTRGEPGGPRPARSAPPDELIREEADWPVFPASAPG